MSALAQRRTAAAVAIMMLFAVLQLVLFAVNPAPARAEHAGAYTPGNPSNECGWQGEGSIPDSLYRKYQYNGGFGSPEGAGAVSVVEGEGDFSYSNDGDLQIYRIVLKVGNGVGDDIVIGEHRIDQNDTLDIPQGLSHVTFCLVDLPPPVGSACPVPDVDEAIVVEFDQDPSKIHASRSEAESVDGPYAIDLPAGAYDVYLTSRDSNHAVRFDPTQLEEQYFVRGFLAGVNVWESPAISDLPDDLVKLTELVGASISIPTDLDQISAVHAAYPDEINNSIQPICVVFVPQSGPPPTPVSVVVSGTCAEVEGGFVARVSVDSIEPDGDVTVTIGGTAILEGASADLALDTSHAVVATSPSGDWVPTTNVSSITVLSESCDTPQEPTPVSVVVSGTCAEVEGGFVARVSVDSIEPDGDVTVTIGGTAILEGASADLALDTSHAVVATSPSGDWVPTTNVSSITVLSASCDTPPPPPPPPSPPAPLTGALGDFVFFDTDGDGVQDAGETGVNGVSVTLLSSDGDVLAQQVTGTDGLYLFDDLEAGTYRVEFCLANAVFTLVNQGTSDAVDSDAFVQDDGCGLTALITLDAGETDLTWDAGIVEVEVRGIQIEPTTTTTPPPVEPVTVDTLPFTGLEIENVAMLALAALIAGAALLLMSRGDDTTAPAVTHGWTND